MPTTEPADDTLDALVAVLRAERERVGDEAFGAALQVATGHRAPEAPAIGPRWLGALYASAVWALMAGLLFYANDQSSFRPEGGSMTGGVASSAEAPMQPAPDFDSMAAPLEARLAANPKDLEALNELTQLALSSGNAQKAMEYNQAASEVAPNDPDVVASKAVLAAMVGMAERALGLLDDVLKEHPDHARSITYKGLLMLEERRYEEAVPLLQKAVALQPNVPQLQQALQAAQRGGGPGGGGPPPAAPAPTGPATTVISGTISLGPGASPTGKEILFISVRSPEGGPPLAAKRLTPSSYPLEFEITTADAISMGGPPRPFPAMMSISARLDGDGNAMTREDLPSAGSGGVVKGTTGLKLVLE